MPEHPYGLLSLLPPIVAIVLAIATRRVVVSLLAGVLIASLVLAGWNPIRAVPDAVANHLWTSLSDGNHLCVFAFTLLMGAMVGVIHRCGGMHGVVDRLAPLARTRRGGQLVTWAMGLIVFFDDYANTLLLGGTMRPLADRLKISREKLAFLVDSTAAPVAGLAIISTWVAGEIEYINLGFAGLQLADPVNGLDVFIQTIPFRFYVIWVLLFVPMVAWFGRDFGPMLRAERKTAKDGMRKESEVLANLGGQLEPPPEIPRRWYNAVVPVLVMIGVTVWLLMVTGASKVRADPHLEPSLFNAFSQGNTYVALLCGALAGLLSAALLVWLQGILGPRQLSRAALAGACDVLPALAVLWMAWSLSHTTNEEYLQTAGFLGGLVQQGVPVVLMPTIVFVLASLVAFATGTSWGTMGILMPLVIAVTYRMLSAGSSAVGPTDTLLCATIGSVLAGAIFGDHCSPISDTTVLSSHASGCNHVAHVWTQLPYALVVAVVSILCGTLPVGLGVPVWSLLPLGAVALWGLLFAIGRPVDQEEQAKAFPYGCRKHGERGPSRP